MADSHRYRASLSWQGSTSAGYDHYERAHEARTDPPTAGVSLSADPTFRGDPDRLNPEQLIVLAASSCLLLSFLAVAARARLDVVAYEDTAEGEMPADNRPMWITRIVLRPAVTIRSSPDRQPTSDRLEHLLTVAHDECFIANSLRSEIVLAPSFTFIEA